MNVVSDWLSSDGSVPLGFCYQWKPTLIWLHAISDTLIALAYFSIPAALFQFVRRRRDIPFGWMFVCFGVFITTCGATHAMEVWTLWVPSYWISGAVKAITALSSVTTAILLFRLMPTALSLPSPEQMRAANEQLKRQAATLKESDERFRQMAENIQEVFWMMNPETKEATYVSPAFEQICELPLDSLYSHPTSYRELIHPQDRQRVLAGLEKLESTNRLDEEFRIVCPSGTVKWLRGIGFVAKDPVGKVVTFVGTVQEITARKEMEVVLRESEDRYRDLVEHSTDLICTHTLEGRLLSVNELPAKLLGYSREELLNKPMRDFLLPEARAQFDESLLRIQRDGFVKGLMVVLTKTGERRIWEYHNTLRTEGVSVPIVRGIAHDITDQMRLEKAVRLSEEKFAKAFHSSPVEMAITALQEGLILDVNESFERNSGYTRDEVIGHTAIELGVWNNPDERAAVIEHIKKQGRLQDREIRFRTKSGSTRVKRCSAEQIEIGGKQCLLTVCEDVTLRKQMEEELRLSEEKFAKAFRSSPSIISISTLQEGVLLEVNESFERHSGYGRNELLGQSALDVGIWIDTSERETLVSEIEKKGCARDQEIHIRAKSGQVGVIQISVELIELHGKKCLLTVGQDITERKRAEEQLRQAQARTESILDSVADVHILFDRQWRFLYVNGAAERAIGLPRDQILGRTLWEIYPDIAGTEVEREYHRAMDERVPVAFDFYYSTTQTWWENRFYPAPEGLAVFATDITQRKQAEEARRRTEELFQAAFAQASVGFAITDTKGQFVKVNEAYSRITGYSAEELYAMDRRTLTYKEDLPSSSEWVRRLLAGEIRSVVYEKRYVKKSGELLWVQMSVSAMRDEGGAVSGLVGLAEDINERKKAEARLQEYEKAVEGVEEMILVVDREYRYLLANRAYLKHRGQKRKEVVGRLMPEVVGKDVFERTIRNKLDASFEGKIVKYEKKFKYRGIGERDLFVSYFPIEGPHGIDRVACILQDITERKRAEAKFQALLEAAPDAMVIVNRDGTIVLVNVQTERLFGYKREELLGQPVDLLVPEHLRGAHAKHRQGFFSHPRTRPMGAGLDLFGLRRDGSQFPIEISLSPLETEDGVLVFGAIRDVTDRKVLEEQLRRAQKMESIGQLAGGIAHDFNNLLTVILGQSDQLLRNTEPADPRHSRLREIREAAERARWVTAQLLIFGRRQAMEFQVINPNELVQGLRLLFERLIDEDILLITDLSPTLGRVKADPGLLQQALMNLVVNAGDAMPSGGTLTIKTADVEVDAADASLHPGAATGSYVVVSVGDDGVGMPADVLQRIFEPFFTTKGPDKGTGLGLAMVHSIVAQSGGYVTVRSEPDHGSTFSLFLPRVLDAAPTAVVETNEGEIPTGSETCLVVEDAGKVRALTSEYLESGGYRVLQAADGQQALAVARSHEGPIHLLVTDVVMPGMSGPELAGSLAKAHPEMKVLLVSGHANETALRHGVMDPTASLLTKPFTQDVLLRKVREVLDSQPSSLSN